MAFAVPLNRCTLQIVEIKNSQVAVENIARNVQATIDYVHDGGDKVHVDRGTWRNVNPLHSTSPGVSLVQSLGLSGDESQNLIITMQQEGTGKAIVLRDEGRTFEVLSIGHWSVTVQIKSDNTEPLVLTGGFTVYSDAGSGMRLVPDQPAFDTKRPWWLRNWKGSQSLRWQRP